LGKEHGDGSGRCDSKPLANGGGLLCQAAIYSQSDLLIHASIMPQTNMASNQFPTDGSLANVSALFRPKTLLFLAAAKLTKPGLKLCFGVISHGFDQWLARAAKPCQNSKGFRGFSRQFCKGFAA
jgi:hypothetical protein